jgi:hypothetical protein
MLQTALPHISETAAGNGIHIVSDDMLTEVKEFTGVHTLYPRYRSLFNNPSKAAEKIKISVQGFLI